MKTLLYLSVLGLLSCTNQPNQTGKVSPVDTTATAKAAKKVDNSAYYITQDTLIIPTEIGVTLKYDKQTFNQIVDEHAELYSDYPEDPDEVYACNGRGRFGSEVGRDEYYMLYAYFLKKKNGQQPYLERRKRLIDIYSNINSLFGHFEYGGTYFGHQSARILGYAEYSIYLYKLSEKYQFSKTYDIAKQKACYIASLRQLIKDESTIDFNVLGKEKIEHTAKLNAIVDEIDKAITDNYYLRRAQAFHYGHYEYY